MLTHSGLCPSQGPEGNLAFNEVITYRDAVRVEEANKDGKASSD